MLKYLIVPFALLVNFKLVAMEEETFSLQGSFDIYWNSQLGTGGDATVYLGRFHDQNLAIKIYNKTSVQTREEAADEINVLTSLGIIIGSGIYNNKPFIVMPRYFGQDLYRLLFENKEFKFTDEIRKKIFYLDLIKLDRLHLNGYCHRDHKLQNIIYDHKTDDLNLIDHSHSCPLKKDNSGQIIITTPCVHLTSAYQCEEELAGISKREFYNEKFDWYKFALSMAILLTGGEEFRKHTECPEHSSDVPNEIQRSQLKNMFRDVFEPKDGDSLKSEKELIVKMLKLEDCSEIIAKIRTEKNNPKKKDSPYASPRKSKTPSSPMSPRAKKSSDSGDASSPDRLRKKQLSLTGIMNMIWKKK